MKWKAWKLLPLLIPFFLISPTSAPFSFINNYCADESGTYSPNSPYQTNLQTVLNSLKTDTRITYGFYNFTGGHPPDKVHSLALCRGDVPLNTCRYCIQNSASLYPNTCPNQKEGFAYSEYCSIFISNRSIYGHFQDKPNFFVGNNPASNPHAFNRSVYSLVETLQIQAAKGNAELKYKSGNVDMEKGGKLYGQVQCTPDLSSSECSYCLRRSLAINLANAAIANSGTLLLPSCSIYYDTSPFAKVVDMGPTFLSSSPTPTKPHAIDKRSTTRVNIKIIILTIVCATFIISVVGLFVLLRRNRISTKKSWVKLNDDEINTLESLRFNLKIIKHATQDFSASNKLGRGGYGTVYKGVLSDGQEIAVKRLGRNTGKEGDVQFKNEILILAKLQHRNLVKLLGYCLHKQEMLLVYEFMPNSSLDKFLFDSIQRESMMWETRFKIIDGISRGLLYLHEESRIKIIHRDLKAANVLLDSNFNPKIADFGMARLFDIDQTRAVASNIAGTFGYMPPEYVFQGQVSMKLDVYGFGVLILEIISGQKINKFLTDGENPKDLLTFAWNCWRDGKTMNLVDSTIQSNDELNNEMILRCIHIGLLCVQHNQSQRPTMSWITLMLRSTSLSLPTPSQPALFTTTTSSNTNSVDCSVNFLSVTQEFIPR